MFRWLPNLLEWLAGQAPERPVDRTDAMDVVRSGGDAPKPMLEHLEELRATLIRAGLAWVVAFNLCLLFAPRILRFLELPLRRVMADPESCLQSLNVTDSFVLSVQLAGYGGLILALPLMLYFAGQFILPALNPRERRALVPAFLAGGVLFAGGAALCYYAMVPQTLKAFVEYSGWLGIKPQWTISSYIGFVTQFMLAVGLVFEVPLVILLLVRVGVVQARTVARGRRGLIAAAVIAAAVLAPPDPLSMVVMVVPLIVMCELTIWLARLVERPPAG